MLNKSVTKMKLGIITLACVLGLSGCRGGASVPDVTSRAFAKSVVLTVSYGAKSFAIACSEVVDSKIDTNDMNQIMEGIAFGGKCTELLDPVMTSIGEAAIIIDKWRTNKSEDGVKAAACAAASFARMVPEASKLLATVGAKVPLGVTDALAMAGTMTGFAVGCGNGS